MTGLGWQDRCMGYKFNFRFPGFQRAMRHPHRVVKLITKSTGLKFRKHIGLHICLLIK